MSGRTRGAAEQRRVPVTGGSHELRQPTPTPGTAVAGWVGAESRYEYTVIGDPVNEAARLTDEAKSLDVRLPASARLVEKADDHERACRQEHEAMHLRGRSSATPTYRPTDLEGKPCSHQQTPAETPPSP